ncbi:MAG TPA: hypothetical protein VI542_37820 [Candidatus Tectomicrobia bacterium]
MDQGTSAALVRTLISMQARLVEGIADQRELNRQLLAQNARLDVLMTEIRRQRERDNPN